MRIASSSCLEMIGSETDGRLTTFGQDGQRIKQTSEKLAAQQEAANRLGEEGRGLKIACTAPWSAPSR